VCARVCVFVCVFVCVCVCVCVPSNVKMQQRAVGAERVEEKDRERQRETESLHLRCTAHSMRRVCV